LEKLASASVLSVAATAMMFGASYPAGYLTVTSLFDPLLPADATKSMLFALALLISSSSPCEKPPMLQLADSTRTLAPVAAPAWITNWIASMASATVPTPVASRNFAAIIVAVQLTPATPLPLFPTAPIVPATCVPWPLSSYGSHVRVMALKPCVPMSQWIGWPPIVTVNGIGADHTFAAGSEWV